MNIRLTAKGRKRISHYLEMRGFLKPIERPKTWDRQWRIILFDIPSDDRTKRNEFRSFIRRLGAVMLQKSVWIYPFDCESQVLLLRKFFNFTENEVRLVIANFIGEDKKLRMQFQV